MIKGIVKPGNVNKGINKTLRIIATLIIMLTGTIIVRWRLTNLPTADFIAYWSAARIVLTGGNPYSVEEMLHMEMANGWPANSGLAGLPPDYAHMIFNPPWTIFFVIPLGFVDYLTSRSVFFLFSIGAVLFSTIWIWVSLGGSTKKIWIPLVLIFSFPSTRSLIMVGNFTVFPLLGVSLFLWLAKQKKWFWAGMATNLIFIKPHNAYLFVIALVLWIFIEKRWSTMLGGIFGFAIAMITTLIFVPDITHNYLTLLNKNLVSPWLNASMGSFLRLKFGYDNEWLNYAPMILGLVWFLGYWFKRLQGVWDWNTIMPNVLIASVATSPYTWLLDIILVAPAIIFITLQIKNIKAITTLKRILVYIFIGIYLVIIIQITFFGKNFVYPHDLWWLGCSLWICFIGLDKLLENGEHDYPNPQTVLSLNQ